MVWGSVRVGLGRSHSHKWGHVALSAGALLVIGSVMTLANPSRAFAATASAAASAPVLAVQVPSTGQAAGWAIDPSLPYPRPNGVLQSVACPSPTTCLAVGTFDDLGVREVLAEMWDGRTWKVQPSPANPDNGGSVATSVSCTSPTSCVAVGNYFSDRATVEVLLAEVWNGITWAPQTVPLPADDVNDAFLNGVSCTSAIACVAVGSYDSPSGGAPLVEQWNGSTWRVLTLPGLAPAGLSAVSCTSSTACTAVGYSSRTGGPFVLALTGTVWTVQPAPSPTGAAQSSLTGVACSSQLACIAVGDAYYGLSAGTLPLAERWDGTAWTVVATPDPAGSVDAELRAVSCPSPTTCVATGVDTTTTGRTLPLTETWNGVTWSREATPYPLGSSDNELDGVSCLSSVTCVAVGSSKGTAGVTKALTERSSNSGWRVQFSPDPSGGDTTVFDAVSCTSATSCTAVGYHVDISGVIKTLAEGWDGTTWAVEPTFSPTGGAQLNGVSCTSPVACVAVGTSGTSGTSGSGIFAERWDGTVWTVQVTPEPSGATSAALNAVSCSSSAACVAVGDYVDGSGHSLALAEELQASGWAIRATPVPVGSTFASLSGVSCPSPTYCSAVGDFVAGSGLDATLAEVFDGTAWSVQTTPNPSRDLSATLTAVSCPSAGACTTIGTYVDHSGSTRTLAEQQLGTSWILQPTPIAPVSGMAGVSCVSPTACRAVGSAMSGSITVTVAESWDGKAWTVDVTPDPSGAVDSAFTGVSCTAPTACTAVGYDHNPYPSGNTPLSESLSG